ncbi:MAG TPA: hypothetical protein VJS42_09520 [Steroidobacteraceae bacterium]|nr:hypothetical protein [Steroidobacteraceae bacterium]
MNSAAHSNSPPRRSRTSIWMLVALFFTPLLLAFVLYYGLPHWRPSGTTSHGDLMTPARALPALPFRVGEVGHEPRVDPQFWQGKWSLVFTGAPECDARCRKALVDMRQVRLALNQEMTRVQRVFVPTGECCNKDEFAAHEGLLIARLPSAELQRFYAQLPRYADGEPDRAGRIYVVDPLGNVMMSYSATAPAAGMLKDLKKLLKLSHIG